MQGRRALVALGMLLVAGGVAWAGRPTKRPSDAARGEELYSRHCASCHGATGAGNGAATAALIQPVPDLRGKIGDPEDLVAVVQLGRGTMPGFETSFDKHDTLRTLKHLAKVAVKDAPATVAPPSADDGDSGADTDAEAGDAPAGGGDGE